MMGGLALRGIRNDQALVERENSRQAKESGDGIIDFTESVLVLTEQQLGKQLPVNWTDNETFFSDSALLEFTYHHSMVHGVFYVDQESVKMLRDRLQYLPKSEFKKGHFDNLLASIELEAGWKYEYQDRDIKRALSFYQGLMPDLSDDYSKAVAMNSIARLYRKAGDLEMTVKSYELLSQEYGDYRINKSMPLGLIADAELAPLLLEQGDTVRAIQVEYQIAQNLINQKWELDAVSYSLFSIKALEFIHELRGHLSSRHEVLMMQLDSLHDKREILQLETRNLLSLRLKISEILSDRIDGNKLIDVERWNEIIGGTNYLISIHRANDNAFWCLLISTDELLDIYVNPHLRVVSDNGRWYWLIENLQGETLASTEEDIDRTDYVEMSFPAGLPAWTMLAIAKPLSPFQSFFQSGQGVYLFIFLFIGAVLIMGSLFIMYSINRELQITRMKSDFVATVSHEFKSPITAIRQITEMLQSGRVPDERRDKYYAVMLQQGARLTHLIDNILDFSSIERGKRVYVFEETDVGELLQNIVGRYEKRIEDKDFVINLAIFPDLPKVNVDSEAMRQVLYNLLDNAVKYSGSANVIDICVEQNNGTIITSIRDYGIGISKEEQGKIFERFYRAGNKQTHQIKGSGIGLSLVKKIIEAHGGRTQVESAPGKGSTFYLHLPVRTN